MPEPESKNTDNAKDQKTVQFHAALYNGWIQTRMEKDKSLLTLSGGAIALLITLLSALKTINISQFIIAIVAIACFIISLFCLIAIFQYNAEHLQKVATNKESSNSLLSALDKIVVITFSIGIILSLIFALIFGAQRLYPIQEGENVSNLEKRPGRVDFGKSLDGISEMNPDVKPSQVAANTGTDSGTASNNSNSKTENK